MKWIVPVSDGPRPRRARATLVSVAVFLWAGVAAAQIADCGDTLTLYSPSSLDIQFERSAVSGNRLTWPGIPAEDGACFRVDVDPVIAAAVQPRFVGQYSDFYDREISFSVVDSGLVGDRTLDRVRLSFESFPPNDAIPSFTGSLNASDRGGIFRASITDGGAVQSNDGIPPHLPSTDVTAMASTPLPGGGVRIYAAVNGLPIVRSDDGGVTWTEPLPQLEPAISVQATSAAASPTNPDRVFLGTDKAGVFRSDDGGATFRRADTALTTANPPVTLLKYLRVENASGSMVDRLYLSMSGVGFFFSDDDGDNWTAITTLDPPRQTTVNGAATIDCTNLDTTALVRARDVAVSPTDPSRIYVALRTWAVYVTDDDHQTWQPVNSGLVTCGTGGQTMSIRRLLVLDAPGAPGQDFIYAASDFDGIFVSADGGSTWGSITDNQVGYPGVAEDDPAAALSLLPDPRDPSGLLVVTASDGIVAYSLNTWSAWDAGPGLYTTSIGSAIVLAGSDDDLVIGTRSAGVYTPGEYFDITRAIESTGGTVVIGLGLEMQQGLVQPREDAFKLTGQTFQAYAVWRATQVDPVTQEPEWTMIGLFDLTNPEACSVDPCDSPSQNQITGCFANKRANCFTVEFDENGQLVWGFYDNDVFNGFTYYYAVSTLDYGNTANASPLSFAGDFLYSPRSPLESNPQATLFMDVRPENYNTRVFQVNVDPAPDLSDVFVVPNPLRRQGSWDGEGQSTLRFVGVTASSQVQVFTIAGDLVRELENVVTEGQERGNIQWDTRNAEGELVASGVYIYRVTDEVGGEFVGRLTIIR